MGQFIKIFADGNKKGLPVEKLLGYESWFSQVGEEGVLCWVSSRGPVRKTDIALIKSVWMNDVYYPKFIPANPSPDRRGDSEEGCEPDVFLSYQAAIPLAEDELQAFATLAAQLDRSNMSKIQ